MAASRIALACALLVLAGCGGGDGEEPEPSTGAETTGGQLGHTGADRARFTGRSGTAEATACELVGVARVERAVGVVTGAGREPLERSANDSLDLSFCEFRERSGPEVFVRIGLDTATRAVRRYYNMITEARQLPNIFDPSKENRPQLVFDVGDDGTYGGAGAYWIPSRLELNAISDQRIVKVHFYVAGTAAGNAKRAAAGLARLAFAGYAKLDRRRSGRG